MQTTEITVTVHKRVQVESGQARRRTSLRRWIARLNGWTVVWYVLLTVAGILLYKAGADYAMRERKYSAVGGEVLTLALPVLYYAASTIIGDIVRELGKTVMGCRKKKKPSAKRPPADAVAWCVLHRRLMNNVYIRRRGCVMRQCKHPNWLGEDQPGKTE